MVSGVGEGMGCRIRNGGEKMNIVHGVISKLMDWLLGSFGKPLPHAHYLPIKREPFQPVKVKKIVEKNSWVHSKKNLSELLDSMEETFHLFSIPTGNHPLGTDRQTIKGIKTLGPVVPCYVVVDSGFDEAKKHKNDSGFVPNVDLDLIKKSSFMCMKNYFGKDKAGEKEENLGLAEFVYATKLKKLPWYVEQRKGIPYEFGEGFAFTKDITWIRSYLVVDPRTGATAFCKMRRGKSVVQRPKNKTRIEYSRNIFDNPLVDETNRNKDGTATKDNNDANMRFDFWALTHFWKLRDYEWTVAVRKDGQRVQFSVPREMTKYFFKDRGKTVTVNGNTQPIVHIVSEHKRTLQSGKTITVKEHIRGVSAFEWKDFSCTVSAPKFHLFARTTLPTGATILEEYQEKPLNMVGMDYVAKRIAEAEETNHKIGERR